MLHRHTHICKIRAYNTRMGSLDISELHCKTEHYERRVFHHIWYEYIKSYGDKKQMFLRSWRVRCLLSHVMVDAIAAIGSECCLEFVIFLQPTVMVTIIHDLVTTLIVVHDRFTTNGYPLPVPHVPSHKMDLQWKPQSNLYKKNFTLVLHEVVIKISTALHSVCICIRK